MRWQMGTEDSLVHSIKLGRVVMNAPAAILPETATLIAGNEDSLDESDHFATHG